MTGISDRNAGGPEYSSSLPSDPSSLNNSKDSLKDSNASLTNSTASLRNSIGESFTGESSASLKERNIQMKQSHIQEMAELFNSSIALKATSQEHPLIPFNADSQDDIQGNANDVYMTHFSNEHDVVFKPGVAAATRSKICFGLTKLFQQLENVIVAAKEGQATVISRDDYKVERAKVYNPEDKASYLIDKDLLADQSVLKEKVQKGKNLEGKIGKQAVQLVPVDGRPGFYKVEALSKGASSEEVAEDDWGKVSDEEDDWGKAGSGEEDDWGKVGSDGEDDWLKEDSVKEEESWDNDFLSDEDNSVGANKRSASSQSVDSSSSSEEEIEDLDDFYVMRISSEVPSRIDTWVEQKAAWSQVNDGRQVYLAPSTEILEIEDSQGGPFVTINEVPYSIVVNDSDNSFVLYPQSESSNQPLAEDPANVAKGYVLLMDENDQQVLVNKEAQVPYEDGDDSVVYAGKNYEVQMGDEDGVFELVADEVEGKESFLRVEEDEWLSEDRIQSKNGKEYVTRNGQDYEVKAEGKKFEVLGKDVRGMVQLKVQNVFQKSKDAKVDLDLLEPSQERKEFYERVDMPGFIQAFVATVLLRPQDGKVVNLGESNVLFQALPNGKNEANPLSADCKLTPVIIDLDETMPAVNDYLQSSKYDSGQNVHIIRNGLMGFPHARQKLSGQDKQVAEASLREIIGKKSEAEKFLSKFVSSGKSADFSQENVEAYAKVVDKIKEFLDSQEGKDWSLQDLFFFTFPEYESQWNALGDLSPERKAQYIGKNSLSEAAELGKRYHS